MIDQSLQMQFELLRAAGKRVNNGSLDGCCAAMALIVQATAGGDLLGGTVEHDGRSEPHFWNRLPCGTEVDLTSCQFGGDGFTPLTAGTPCERPELIDPEHLLFAAAVYHDLYGEPAA